MESKQSNAKTPNERLNHVFSNSCSSTRAIVFRVLIFVLTASIGQGLVYLFKGERRDRYSVIATRTAYTPNSTPVSVETLPQIEFPKSLRSIGSVDFWVRTSMVVEANGTVRDVQVDMENAVTAEGTSFYDQISAKTNGKRATEITNEVIEALTKNLKDAKFTPRTFRGQSLPTMAFVHSHFRVTGACWSVDIDFKTSEGVFGGVLMQSAEPCGDSKLSVRRELKAVVSQ